MDATTAQVIEIHSVPCGQANTGQILLAKNIERVYNQDKSTDLGTKNNSNVETMLVTAESEPLYSRGIIGNTLNSPSQIVKIVKQHHSYTSSNESIGNFNLESICTETVGEVGDDQIFVTTLAPSQHKTVGNEVSRTKSLLLGLDNSQSNMSPDTQVSSRNLTSEKKSPVIMFKWGSVKKPFRCQICDMSFTDGNLLRSHLEKHKNSRKEPLKPFPCSLCTKSFQSNRSLERHQIVHSGQSQKRCKLCYKVFANKENLDKHLLMHSGNVGKTLPCPSCNEQFTSRSLLEKHISSTHWQIKSFHCHVCEKSFSRKDGLDRHLYTHDLGKMNKHKCVECSKSFSFLFALKRHVRSVHGGEPDGKNCEVCGKFIKNKENIGRHMQLHEGVRPFDCLNCGRKFSQKQHLIDHMVIHTNSLPFQCKICSYSFRYRRTLSRHMKKHYKVDKDKLKYECMDCHTIYPSEEELIQHASKSHYDYRNCIICDKTFIDEKTYRQHMLKDHNSPVGLLNKNLVNKSTETDTDLSLLGFKTEAERVELRQVRELNEDDQDNVVYTVNSNKDDDVSIENEFEYSGESVEDLAKDGNIQNIHYEVKSEITDGEEVVYILYDDRKVEGMEDNDADAVIPESVHIPKFIQEQPSLTENAEVENQVVHISGFDTQSSTYELEESRLEENAEEITTIKPETKVEDVDNKSNKVVALSQDGDAEQALIEIVDNDTCQYPSDENINTRNDAAGKKILYTYNVVVPKKDTEGGTVENKEEESDYSAERFKLLQSLIDYAEKIQEEEQSLSNNEEGSGSSETQI